MLIPGLARVSARALVLLLCVGSCLVYGEPDFPTLNDRVTDTARLLSPGTRNTLINELAAHERASSNQVVVVTVKSLQGYSIDDFGNRLGRHWGIGQKERDNGVLLIVAPNERKVRIEVGYGLEGTLTDALSHSIIQTVILPQFKKNNMQQGIVNGTRAIVQALEGTFEPVEKKSGFEGTRHLALIFMLLNVLGELIAGRFSSRVKSAGIIGTLAFVLGWIFSGVIPGLVLAGIAVIFHFFLGGGGTGGSGGYRSGGYGSGGFGGGGGFSGGGGSFGGGGSSGGW